MKFVFGGINGNYLRFYTDNGAEKTDEVLAAVAYSTDTTLLFDWCERNDIPLKFYGRLSEDVSVTTPILEKFLDKGSLNFSCKLVEHHHAKVIWWQ